MTAINTALPFTPASAFWIYNVPDDKTRGGHRHRTCDQVLIAVSGKFKVWIDGHGIWQLRDPSRGIHIPPGIKASLYDFTPGAICLVLCSHPYDEDDYDRD